MKVSPFKESNFLLSIWHHPPLVIPCLSTAPSYFQGYTPCYASSSLAAGFVVTSSTCVPAISCIQPTVCSVFFFPHVFLSLPADGYGVCFTIFPSSSRLCLYFSSIHRHVHHVCFVLCSLFAAWLFDSSLLKTGFVTLFFLYSGILFGLFYFAASACAVGFSFVFLFPPILSQSHLRLYFFNFFVHEVFRTAILKSLLRLLTWIEVDGLHPNEFKLSWMEGQFVCLCVRACRWEQFLSFCHQKKNYSKHTKISP